MKKCFNGIMLPRGEDILNLGLPSLVEIPGVAPIMLEHGLDGLLDRYKCNISLTCGPYSAGEGLAAFSLRDPPNKFIGKYLQLGIPEGLEDVPRNSQFGVNLVENAIFNPFSWKTLLPKNLEGPGCIETGHGPYSQVRLEPLSSIETVKCTRRYSVLSEKTVSIGGAVVNALRGFRLGLLSILESREYTLVSLLESAIVLPNNKQFSIRLETRAASYQVELLYGAAKGTIPRHILDSGDGIEGNVASVSAPGLNLAVSSPRGFHLDLGPGYLEISSHHPVALTRGGINLGFRSLMELLYPFKPISEAPKHLGNFYSVNSHAMLLSISEAKAVIKAVALSGTGGGTVYFNPPSPSQAVRVYTIYDYIDMPGGPRISIPVPECGCAVIEATFTRKRLFDILKRRRSEV